MIATAITMTVIRRLGPGAVLVSLSQWQGRRLKVADYWVEAVPHDFGARAYKLTKAQPDDREPFYYVLIHDDDEAVCECRGHLAHGHCRHVDCILQLREQGEI